MYEKLKFKSKEEFYTWIKKTTKWRIRFKDQGQDFLEWAIAANGEVIDSQPFQSSIWNGTKVDIKTIKKGNRISVYFKHDRVCKKNRREMNYPLEFVYKSQTKE